MTTRFWVCEDPTCSDGMVIGKSSEISIGEYLVISYDIKGIPLATPIKMGIVEEVVPLSDTNFDFAVKLNDKTVLWLQKTAS